MALDPETESFETSSSKYRKRTLVEIFSVLFLEKDDTPCVDRVLEESLLLSAGDHDGLSKEHVLCDLSAGKPMQQIDSQCYLILTGPKHGIEILDNLRIGPCYDAFSKKPSSKSLWNVIWQEYDIFICDWRETLNGFMVVKFAVFCDGLEARLELTVSDLELLCGMPLHLYSIVTTSNSALPDSEAKSYLFNHHRTDSDSCAVLDLASFGKAEIPLPLSRSVTVIPRDSTLIVDLNLSVRCDSGDISIANESVSFHPATRSNKTVEEHIIKGSCANLKVKVTWVEALEYDTEREERKKEVIDAGEVRDNKKEATEDEEVTDDEEAISTEECDTEDDQGTESQYMSDDDSTGAVDYYTTEAMDIADGEQGEVLDIMSSQVEESGDYYLEVFSIKLLDIENLKLDEIYGLVIIHTPPRLLFRRLHGEASKIDSQGFAILEGPQRCAFNVCDNVYIVPFLFKYQEFEFTGEHSGSVLWRDIEMDNTDKLLCKILDSDFGRIEVNFAVYVNSVWAHLTVMLTDCSFSSAQVHGTITASNSMVQNLDAVSIVFKKEKTEPNHHVTIGPGKEISLPLLRPVVALPLGSIFTLRADIFFEGNHPPRI